MACNKTQVKDLLTKAFHEVDLDKSGFIEGREIENVLTGYYKAAGKPVKVDQIKTETKSFMQKVDKNHDNKISLDEFLAYFTQFCA
jgi:Ca2+-binding EF-hand superfamily protein